MNPPNYFCDEMIEGAFKSMRHEHFFDREENATLMTDKFVYETPFSIFGEMFNNLILEKYMKRLLLSRNETIKRIAESGEWEKVLSI
jgi:ligand-binding SRPBCC domain-containing protein